MSTLARSNVIDAAFAAWPLTKRLGRTAENYLICCDAVISRTATRAPQEYLRSEIEPGGGREVVRVYRLPEEVFSPVSLGTFEGKPIAGPVHPSGFINADNHQLHSRGHVQNVRRAGWLLPDGEEGVLGDLVITDPVLADMIESGSVREISCGYDCEYVPFRDGYAQTNIRGNHIAVLAKGRAGSDVRVYDAKPVTAKDVIAKLDKAISTLEDALESRTVGAEADSMVRGSELVTKLSESGVGPHLFHKVLERSNQAYAEYSQQSEAGADYARALRAAGEEMQRKFRPKACADAAPPLREHKTAEDYGDLMNQHGARLRGGR